MYAVGGFPWLVWGFCLPTMTLAHATFAINTINHLYGSRRFDTLDGALAWARHLQESGRVALSIDGDDGTSLSKQEIVAALRHAENERISKAS